MKFHFTFLAFHFPRRNVSSRSCKNQFLTQDISIIPTWGISKETTQMSRNYSQKSMDLSFSCPQWIFYSVLLFTVLHQAVSVSSVKLNFSWMQLLHVFCLLDSQSPSCSGTVCFMITTEGWLVKNQQSPCAVYFWLSISSSDYWKVLGRQYNERQMLLQPLANVQVSLQSWETCEVQVPKFSVSSISTAKVCQQLHVINLDSTYLSLECRKSTVFI